MSVERGELAKTLGPFQYFALGFGTIIGVGWVVVLGDWFNLAAPVGASIALLLGGLLMVPVGLCYAEVGTMIPVAGGEMAYGYRIYGSRIAFAAGWLLALAYLSVAVFEAVAIGFVLANLIPAVQGSTVYTVAGAAVTTGGFLVGLIATEALAFLNYRGVSFAAATQNLLTYGLVAVAAVFFAGGFLAGDPSNLTPIFVNGDAFEVTGGIVAVLITVPFFLAGFNVIPQLMEERATRSNLRSIGLVIVLSIMAATAFYVLVLLSSGFAAPWQETAQGDLPAADAIEAALGGPFSRLVLFAALLGLLTSWNAVFMAASRILFSLGRGRFIPTFFGANHPRFKTPHRAVLFIAVLCIAGLFLGQGAIIPIVNLASTAFAIAFIIVCVGYVRMRRAEPDTPRPYRAPGGLFTGIAGATAGVLILALSLVQPFLSTGRVPLEWLLFAAWILIGIAFWAAAARVRRRVDETERRRLILGDTNL